ncbi:hypothetical protein MNEG_7347 [Monoraphidium neglectum]|uniref:Uncharacterized protein n=1 Tax=Monoraphidium neglectum TaxID=145388 RepID=A0A0D2JN77_9CHLO|nr:hypothetical protein MNEG_7347 [Monoraphidium neglectum]KIZ00613.1 hypothetical protein MNEG_7347 [Monoraphidium neglectum]|eukprot:XP_013899632.1 hypothetical protein MNEG_7347 [Monoraphidium neglectum]
MSALSPPPLPRAAGGAGGGAGAPPPPSPGGALDLESGLDISALIHQLSLKKDEGMVDDKLIRDLQIIQNLIGALKAPACTPPPSGGGPGIPAGGLGSAAGGGQGLPGLRGPGGVRRSFSYSPGGSCQLQPSYSLPH